MAVPVWKKVRDTLKEADAGAETLLTKLAQHHWRLVVVSAAILLFSIAVVS